MDSSFFQVFNQSTVEGITIYFFLIVIAAGFIKYFLFRHDTESRGIQKIIGGLAVFVVALLSQNLWIQALSLFIGGLIIASEDFMQKLAIIVKSESPDIGKNLETTKPTKAEIQEKRKKEIQFQQSLERKNNKPATKSALLRTVELADSLVSDYFKQKLGTRFRENIKFEGTDLIVDGIIFDEQQNIDGIVEIKQMPSLDNAVDVLKYEIKEIQDKTYGLKILFCIVLDNKPIQSEINRFTNQMNRFDNVKSGIFYLKKDKLIPIVEPKI